MKLLDLLKEPEELAGPFEAQIMTAIEILGNDAYSVPIQRKVEEMTGKRASLGKIFITLDRMEDKGYIGSKITEKPGHRPRRYYWLRRRGAAVLNASMSTSRRAIEELDGLGFFKLWKRKRV
jgi:PadR family transcriptional regulator PadR